jgi:dephospho-CoA kinase
MKRILITGMPATGKSSVIAQLAEHGYRAIDLDDDGRSFVDSAGEWVWDEARIEALMDADDGEAMILGGCAPNQGKFYPRFDAIVLLSAPPDVIIERLTSRTNNPYGKQPEQRAKALRDQEEWEPVLRRRATHEIDTSAPLDDVVTQVLSILRSDA